MGYAITVDGLTKDYVARFSSRRVRAVDALSLKVREGTAFGLLGANGAGKTTLVKMLLGAVLPSSGTAAIFGVNHRKKESRRPVGYLPENHRFPTYNTGWQMLDFYAALSGMKRAERRKRADELIGTVGLSDWAGVRIGKYSKGMLQRLGLAQALMHRPRLLILDEPGDGVDPVGRRQIRDILQKARDEGTTIFLNSHLLAEVELFCEDVAIISKGQLAAEGRVSELTAQTGYVVAAEGVPDGARDAVVALGAAPVSANGFLSYLMADREGANQVIDTLRGAGVEVESVARQRSSLEEVFIQAVKDAGPGGQVSG